MARPHPRAKGEGRSTAWIESHQSLLNHRKTGRLARRLGISKITAIGHLHAFWWWCMDNAPGGDLASIDSEDIADGSGWEGDPEEFVQALIFAGFVDGNDGTGRYCVHDWYDYAGKLIDKRKQDAERKRADRREARPRDIRPPEPPPVSPVQRTSDGQPEDGAGTVPNRTVPNPTEPNRTRAGGAAAPDARKRATRLPPDFPLTDERRDLIRRERPDLDPEWFHDEFCSYWRGSGQPKVDWDQTYRNGLLKAKGPPRAVRDRADPTAMPARTARNIRILQEVDA